MQKSNYYINKEELQNALMSYKQACLEASESGDEDPPIPNYIGECFVKMATKISYRPNFIGYSFKDEMVSDGIENCLLYFRNYDASKSNNPFGYFTKIIWYAFLRRIAKEKRELAKKYKYIENIDITDIVTQEHDSGDFTNTFAEYLKSELDHIDIDKRIVSKHKKTIESDEIIAEIVHEIEDNVEYPEEKAEKKDGELDFD